MEMNTAVSQLSALAHESRLAVYRFLVTRGPAGAPAGVIAKTASLPGATLNFHLEQLVNSGLVRRERKGRSVVYSALYPAIDELIDFLTESCCAARPEECC